MLRSIITGLELTANAEMIFTDLINSGDYEYQIKEDGTAQITKYNGTETNVAIPNTLDGITVTTISYCAFDGNKNLISVVVPDTVTLIESCAFRDCTALADVKLSNTVTYLFGSFENCTNLKSITLPYSLTRLGVNTFKGCTALESITIPANVVEISDDAFFGCKKLKAINVSKDNKKFISINGILYNKNITKLLQVPSKNKIKTYKTPSTVTAIGASAFNGCRSLENVIITDKAKNISSSAFVETYNLKKISVAKKNKYFSAKDGVLFNKKKTVLYHYPSAKKDKTYIIPKTVKKSVQLHLKAVNIFPF